MASRIKNFGAVLLVSVVFFILLTGWVGYFYGAFSTVRIATEIRGPYLMVYMLHRGAYHRISENIEKVGKLLDEQKIPKTIPCAIFYDDPRDVALEDLKSEGGYLVNQRLSLEHPFGLREIPKRGVIIATIKAHPLVAPFKTYGRIVEFMKMHQLEHDGPVMERYLPGGVVEVEMPFRSPNMDQLRNSIKDMHIPGSHQTGSHISGGHETPGSHQTDSHVPGHQVSGHVPGNQASPIHSQVSDHVPGNQAPPIHSQVSDHVPGNQASTHKKEGNKEVRVDVPGR